jgi:phage terminase large subunit-like protein
MNAPRVWDTSCADWEMRLLEGRSLVPELPIYKTEAARALRVFKRLRIPDVVGTPTMAEACGPWFFPIVEALFGSYDPKGNVRHIQEVFQLIPKGNAKSSNGGAVMLTAVIVNRRPEAEFVFVAPTIEVAGIAFKQAKGTIKLDPELDKLFHIQSHLRKITHRKSGAMLQIKAADTDVVTGGKQVGTMIDETHVFAKKSNAAEIFVELRGALTKRPDGFLFQTTTQSKTPPTGVFAAELGTARKVRDGKMAMPLLPVLYELPERVSRDGGWKNRKYWPCVNPNLGRSTSEAFLALAVQRAESDGAAAIALIASQHFNVEIGMALRADGWAGAKIWHDGIEPTLTLDELLARSEVCTVGVDGGGLDDLLGVAVIGREKATKRWLGWAHGLISTIGARRRKANAVQYLEFLQAGELTVFRFGNIVEEAVDPSLSDEDGALAQLIAAALPPDLAPGALPRDIQYVVDLVERIRSLGKLAQVGVDAAGIGAIVDALGGIGIEQKPDDPQASTLDAVRQGIALMGAIKTLERKLADNSFKHGGLSLLTWCVGNLIVVPTPTAMRIGRDESGFGKIDPFMALANASHLMCLNPEAPGLSGWSTADHEDLMAKIDAEVARMDAAEAAY